MTVASTAPSVNKHETLGPVVPLHGPSICRSSRPFSHVHQHPRRVGYRTTRVSAERNIRRAPLQVAKWKQEKSVLLIETSAFASLRRFEVTGITPSRNLRGNAR